MRPYASARSSSTSAPAASREFFSRKSATSGCVAARSQFAADFLACAGLATSIQQFEQAKQIAESDAALIVLCSSDAEYLPITEKLIPILRERGSRANTVIAGNPDTAEQLRILGVADFIHLRSNAVEVLADLQQLMGIRD